MNIFKRLTIFLQFCRFINKFQPSTHTMFACLHFFTILWALTRRFHQLTSRWTYLGLAVVPFILFITCYLVPFANNFFINYGNYQSLSNACTFLTLDTNPTKYEVTKIIVNRNLGILTFFTSTRTHLPMHTLTSLELKT